MFLMALEAHFVDLISLDDNIRRCGTNVFIIGVTGAQTVTAGTGDLCPQVCLTYIFLDKCRMANITGCIGTHGITLIELC